MKRFLKFLLFSFLALVFLYSCKPYKELQPGQYRVNKVEIELVNPEKRLQIQNQELRDNLYAIIKQKPNKKMLGVFNLGINLYAYGNRKDNWLRRWAKKVGEEMVVVDSASCVNSLNQQRLYLIKKGFFLNEGEYFVHYTDSKKRKATVVYRLTPNQPYKIKKLKLSMDDHNLHTVVDSITKRNSKVEIGKNYDEFLLADERTRFETEMKNVGYYNFDKRFVSFDVDSNLNNHGVSIQAHIANPSNKTITSSGNDTLIYYPHKKYTIQEVYIQVRSDDDRYTTIDTARLNGYVFVNSSKNSIRPNVILRTLYFKPGDLYNLNNIQYTYNRLSALKAFKAININVHPRSSSPTDTTLTVFVDLRMSSRHSFTVETEGTNRGGNLGVNGNISLANNNTFKGAEVFQIRFLGGLEAQGTSFEEDPENDQTFNTPFNTFEYGVELGLRLPELFIPKNRSKIPKYDNPGTAFTVGYNYQLRSAYNRDIFKTGLYYDWYFNRIHGFRVGLVDISLVRIDKADWFEEKLIESNNSLLQNSYQNHLISATKFQYEFTNRVKSPNYIFFKTSIESAGNLLRGIHNMSGREKDSTGTYYSMFDIRYAQYVMMDIDLRYHSQLSNHSSAAYRIYGGMGIPLANLNVLPFEKSYYGGGANFNRAWIARTMGPGGMADTGSLATIDRIGDIKLEANFEFRFDIIGSFKGAYFIDVGNIWIREKDEQRPLADFDVNRFYKELAVGTGVGVRYDAGFFVIRFDVGFKIHDPKLFESERWIWEEKKIFNEFNNKSYYRQITNWNLAINYPF